MCSSVFRTSADSFFRCGAGLFAALAGVAGAFAGAGAPPNAWPGGASATLYCTTSGASVFHVFMRRAPNRLARRSARTFRTRARPLTIASKRLKSP